VDGTLLYAVSADDNQLLVVDPTGNACPGLLPPPDGDNGGPGPDGGGPVLTAACIVASVPVGTLPARVIVGTNDTLYVSNRGSRSISVIHRPPAGGAWAVSATLPTDAEPLGMALSPGAQATLYVVNHGSGTVEAFDLTTSAVVWDTTLGNFPRSVAALADGELYVSHYRSGMVDVLDAATGVVLKSVSAAVGAVPSLTQATTQAGTPFQPTFSPVAMDSLVVSPDGARVYLAHRRERSGIISDVSFPPIVAPAITTFETTTDLPHDDALETSQTYPPTIVYPENRIAFIPFFAADGGFVNGGDGGFRGGGGGGGTPGYGGGVAGFGWTQAPVAMVEDNQGQYLFVANQDSNNVTILPASSRSTPNAQGGINSEVAIDEGPNGIALSPDNLTLFIYNAIGKSISVVVSQGGQEATEATRIVGVGTTGTMSSDAVVGRQLFYSAANSQMAAPGSGVACESCHLEGGTDGHVWQFVWGPRKTMGLLGKDIGATAPYHWDGTELLMSDLLNNTITVRMGGSGIDAGQESQVGTFLAQLQPADNPNQLSSGLSASQQNGQTIFMANCAACHAGTDMTDNSFHDVGTMVTVNPNGNPDDPCRLGVGYVAGTSCLTDTPQLPSIPNPANDGGFNTPTVTGVYFAPPYFHDGSAATLDDVIPRMLAGAGLPKLSASDMADLVAYLQTL
jgi:6-phosphogluconolactonase (cycloisomerase 2 family)